MAQIAIIQPAVPQTTQTNMPANSEQSQFSPHLENAIATTKQQLPPKNDTPNSSPKTEYDQLSSTGLEISEIIQELSPLPAETPNIIQLTPKVFPNSTGQANSGILGQQVLNLSSLPESTDKGQLQRTTNEPAGFLEIEITKSSSSAQLTVSGSSKQTGLNSENAALLTRLNQIINNSNETGTVSVTKAESSPAILASMTETPVLNNGLFPSDGEGFKATTGRPDQQLNSLRLETQEQYYEAKVNLPKGGENSTNTQDRHQGSDTQSQASATPLQSSLTTEPETTSTFSQSSLIGPETPGQTSTETAKPIILPSGTVVHEEKIVQQLIERFQISGKLTDTRINIKLNPAELGELKIDLSVKESSIKAHVVAHSQQALEVIEKNISKLKMVLEEQGYTIDEISVTTQSDSVGDFNLFDNQRFSQNDYTPPPGKETRESGVTFNPEIIPEDEDGTSGVNVTV